MLGYVLSFTAQYRGLNIVRLDFEGKNTACTVLKVMIFILKFSSAEYYSLTFGAQLTVEMKSCTINKYEK